jgi:hypothetical protein
MSGDPMAMKARFEQYDWHDAELLHISIDRTNAGHNDCVVFKVRFEGEPPRNFVFENCYAMDAKLNFAIVAPETIYSVCCSEQSDRITQEKLAWQRMGGDIDPLYEFEIVTNSTNSKFVVLAQNFSIQKT